MFGVEGIRGSDVDGIELLAFAHRRYAIECLDAKFGLVLFARLCLRSTPATKEKPVVFATASGNDLSAVPRPTRPILTFMFHYPGGATMGSSNSIRSTPSFILPRDAGEERGGGWNYWNN